MIRAVGRIFYGCYAWLALLACVVPTCVGLAVATTVEHRRKVARTGARWFFFAIGSPISVEGSEIEPHCPCIVVANHASYLDGIILTAAGVPVAAGIIASLLQLAKLRLPAAAGVPAEDAGG